MRRETVMDHIEYLKKKHRELDRRIDELQLIKPEVRSESQIEEIAILKRKKLKLKDELASCGKG